jgi:hypothetical protein
MECKKCNSDECKCVSSFKLVKRKAYSHFESHESWALLALFLLETAIFTV